MDRLTALSRLVDISATLTPADQSVTPSDLDKARAALALSLMRNGIDPTVGRAGVPAPTSKIASDALQAKFGNLVDAAAATSGPAPLALTRSLPAIALGNPTLEPAQTAGMLPQTFGPFVDDANALHWVDLVTPLTETAITRAGAATVALVLPLAVPAGPVPASVAVGPGSVWIDAQLLTPSAPSGSYAGFRISGGTLNVTGGATASASAMEIAVATTLTLTVEPASDAPPTVAPGAPGADGGAVVAVLPPSVTFVFETGGAHVSAAGDAALTAYGSTVAMKWLPAPPYYEPAIAQLLIPYKAQAASLTISSAHASTFTPSGTVAVTAVAWALPVAVSAAAQLGPAICAGSLCMSLDAGLRAVWSGLSGGPVRLGQAFVLGTPGVLALLATILGGDRLALRTTLWKEPQGGTPRTSHLDIAFAKGMHVYFTSIAKLGSATEVDMLAAQAVLDAHVDRPLAADGRRLTITMPGSIALFRTASVNGVLVGGSAAPGVQSLPPIALALRNALLVTSPPAGLYLAAQFSASPTELERGTLVIDFALDALLPTLPDPYAANFLPGRQDRPATGAMQSVPLVLAATSWTPAAAVLDFSSTVPGLQALRVTSLAATPAPSPGSDFAKEDDARDAALTTLFNDTLGGSASPALWLLDVSSNVDQFGVGVSPERTIAGIAAGGPQRILSLQALDLVAPCVDMRVFTPPAMQWEPVVTIPNPNVSAFPSPVGFLDDGGPTLIGANDVTLVPVAPAPLLEQVVDAYKTGSSAATLFTLPFGMKAVATLPKAPTQPLPVFLSRPSLTRVEPKFTVANLQGGKQVSLTAAAWLSPLPSRSPSLPGATVQLRNVVNETLTPQNLSVLGSDVDPTFNDELNPGRPGALVPVTRIDFSGYGASTFSAWTDPSSTPPSVVQVRMNTIVGRVSHEVVQIKSVLYPWGALVVRTITIDRQDNAEMFRYDSGWVAATPGTFDHMPGVITHSGAVRGAYDIREIRDTTQIYQAAGGAIEMTAVHFDADIEIDGVVSGARAGRVPSVGQLGFVQLKPALTAITPADFAALVASEGALGGPVDCVITVGGTAQTMRLHRVEIGNAPHAGAPEFAATARGSLTLPAHGSWSVLARTDALTEPTPVDPDLAIALIRQGPALAPPPTTPWRFAEPTDLWTPDTPSMDYCLLHATDSTRVLFPRPKIENGAHAITSTVAPLLADGFALMEATGVCPRQDTCLAFPNADHELQILAAGALSLSFAPNPFPPNRPSRTLASGAGASIGFEYANEAGAPCTVAVTIAPNDWSVDLTGVNVRLDMTPFDGLMRSVGDLLASQADGTHFANPRLVLSPAMQPLEQILTFLEGLGFPDPFAMSFANGGWTPSKKYKMKAGLQFKFSFDPAFGKVDLGLKVGFGNAAASASTLLTASSQWFAYLGFNGSIQVPVVPPFSAGGLMVFKMEADFPTPAQEKLTLQIGVIVSVGGDLIPGVLKLQASVSFAFMLVVVTTPPTSIGVGVALILSASGQILSGLVGINFTAEADGLLIFQSNPSKTSVQATFDVQVDVSICWFLDFTFEMQTQYTKQIA